MPAEQLVLPVFVEKVPYTFSWLTIEDLIQLGKTSDGAIMEIGARYKKIVSKFSEDAYGEILAKLRGRLKSYKKKPGQKASNWMLTVIYNLGRDTKRREGKARAKTPISLDELSPTGGIDELDPADKQSLQDFDDALTRLQLEEILASLSPESIKVVRTILGGKKVTMAKISDHVRKELESKFVDLVVPHDEKELGREI